MHATDKDMGHAGIVSYKIDNVSTFLFIHMKRFIFVATNLNAETRPHHFIFQVIPKTGYDLFRISSSGNVMLNGPLNFTALSPFYQLRIIASVSNTQKQFFIFLTKLLNSPLN